MALQAPDITYIDTSVWCAYAFNEPEMPQAARWLAEAELDHAATALWTFTEFASAAGLKQRAKGLSAQAAARASRAFEAAAAMVHPLAVVADDFHQAAALCGKRTLKLHAGDALHLAVALRHRCQALASLDDTMNHAARALGLRTTAF